MKTLQHYFLGVCLMAAAVPVRAQAPHAQSYVPPSDTAVIRKLDRWQDYKFGLLMHWGPYSQWGVVESWSICPEDEGWCVRRGPYAGDYFEYKKAYENLQTTFNPVKFNPEKWARAATDGGMRYMVFTTKHHDGFCMFGTKTTHYSVTDAATPFSTNTRANITLELFNAFRKQGMMVGAYFSKPDWHHPDYWDPVFPPFDRNPNYIIERYPEKWKRFQSFTYEQIRELMTQYGPVDILWLDGGWVQPMTPTSPRWGTRPMHQDLNMDSLAALARTWQPGLLVVDRAVEGPNQNYLTPEQHIPGELLPYPWETCMTMATSWSYVPNDTYKPATEIIRQLCTIVARGGNLLLNIAPGPDGDWDAAAYDRLAEVGKWLDSNGKAIYNTRPAAPYEYSGADKRKWVFTESKTGELYAICVEGTPLNEKALHRQFHDLNIKAIKMLTPPSGNRPFVVVCRKK